MKMGFPNNCPSVLVGFVANIFQESPPFIGVIYMIFLDQNQVKDDTDAIKLVLIFIVDYILLSKKDNKLVDKYLWHMVDSLDMFGSFPWGRKSFFLTLEYLKKALKGKQTNSQQDVIYYELFGFPTTFQIWIYECFVSLPKTVISYHGPKIPRICSWSKAFKSKFFFE